MDIGKRIKTLRTRNGLTLEELASRSELSKGFISQLENNVTSPSISTLEDITEVLGVSLENFFKEEKEEKVKFTKEDYFIDEKEKSSITWLVPNVDPHEGEEFAYVLKGEVELVDIDNDKRIKIKENETLYLKGEHSHKIINNSKHDARVIWIITPPLF